MPEAGAVQKAPPQEDREDHREDASADAEEAVPEGPTSSRTRRNRRLC